MPFLIIAHCKRSENVPHYLHSASLEELKRPCPYAHIYESHIFDIGKSRNHLVELALNIPETTHILFVDDDIVVPQRDALAGMYRFLEKQNESIVSGLYYQKYPPHTPLIMAMAERDGKLLFCLPYKDKEVPTNSILRVGAVPAGFLLVKREVFEKIPSPWFVYDSPELKQFVLEDFKHQQTGEDIYFSWKARKYGFKLWVDTRADLLHHCEVLIGRKEVMKSSYAEGDLPNRVRQIREEYLNEFKKSEGRTPA